FDYVGRLGENVVISNNRGVTQDQGITHNGPAVVAGGVEGNGIYITGRVNDVRELKIVNNAINSNRGWDGGFPTIPAVDLDGNGAVDTCRHGNGLSIEANGRVENLILDGNDFRQNFNNGVCIANNGDFSRLYQLLCGSALRRWLRRLSRHDDQRRGRAGHGGLPH
ncbi:MAG: hypothetical protein NZ930_08275, partial [Candidatus Bipolaricaulota bacterium]|nr:hypothetical protein [Candidatus Bipolaricaulota bacterium]